MGLGLSVAGDGGQTEARARGVLKKRVVFLLSTALDDRLQEPPDANRQPPPTANRQPPPTTNHQPPTATNRHPLKERRSHEPIGDPLGVQMKPIGGTNEPHRGYQ